MFPIPTRLSAIAAAAVLTWAAASLLVACSDGNSSGNTGTSTDANATPDDGAIGGSDDPELQAATLGAGPRVELTGEWDSASQRIRLRLHVASFKNLLGLAGHLTFDPTALRLTSLQGLPVPIGSGSGTSEFTARTLAKEAPAGRILLGGARFRKKASPWKTPEGTAVGREPWATAEFEVLKHGTHAIAFDPATVTARNDGNEEVKGVTWGSAEVVWGQGGAQ